MNKILVPTVILAALAVSQITSAEAMEDAPSRTRVVKYADLDLNREAGAETLYARMVSAARSVCESDLLAPHPTVGKPHCAEYALSAGVESVNAPKLTELFQRKQAARRHIAAND